MRARTMTKSMSLPCPEVLSPASCEGGVRSSADNSLGREGRHRALRCDAGQAGVLRAGSPCSTYQLISVSCVHQCLLHLTVSPRTQTVFFKSNREFPRSRHPTRLSACSQNRDNIPKVQELFISVGLPKVES